MRDTGIGDDDDIGDDGRKDDDGDEMALTLCFMISDARNINDHDADRGHAYDDHDSVTNMTNPFFSHPLVGLKNIGSSLKRT